MRLSIAKNLEVAAILGVFKPTKRQPAKEQVSWCKWGISGDGVAS